MDIRYPEVGDLVLLTDDAARHVGVSKCLVLGFESKLWRVLNES